MLLLPLTCLSYDSSRIQFAAIIYPAIFKARKEIINICLLFSACYFVYFFYTVVLTHDGCYDSTSSVLFNGVAVNTLMTFNCYFKYFSSRKNMLESMTYLAVADNTLCL